MSKQQTAVEFIIQQIKEIDKNGFNLQMSKLEELAQQAIQMEREQIVSAVHYGIRSPYTNIQTIHTQIEITKGEQYYEQTYGTKPSR